MESFITRLDGKNIEGHITIETASVSVHLLSNLRLLQRQLYKDNHEMWLSADQQCTYYFFFECQRSWADNTAVDEDKTEHG